MAPYSQKCPCTARPISAAKDAARYRRMADDVEREIVLLVREKDKLLRFAARRDAAALEGVAEFCPICNGDRMVRGNGSAQFGSGRARSTPLQGERVG